MIYYLSLINFLTFIIYGIDKSKAKRHTKRISEKTLILLSFFGGCFGALLGMYFFHHKTKKLKFKIMIPFSIVLWLIILYI